jgi:hypothetical protein
LASQADVIVDAVSSEAGRLLLEAHRRLHASVPLFAELGPDDLGPAVPAERITRGATETEAEAILFRVVPRSLEASTAPSSSSLGTGAR